MSVLTDDEKALCARVVIELRSRGINAVLFADNGATCACVWVTQDVPLARKVVKQGCAALEESILGRN